MRTELDIQTLRKAKRNASEFHEAAGDEHTKAFWAQVVKDCDDEIKAISKERTSLFRRILACIITVNVFVVASIILTGCNMVAGAGRDIQWMGEAGQEMLENGHTYMEK